VTRGKPVFGEVFRRKVLACREIMDQFVRSTAKEVSRFALLGKRVREQDGNLP
jgi:hypothetical protein